MEGADSGLIELHPGILTPRRVSLPEKYIYLKIAFSCFSALCLRHCMIINDENVKYLARSVQTFQEN